jgi:hypothetical protein
MVVEMTIGKDDFSYLVKRIQAHWGRGFEFAKLDNSGRYAVNIDTTSGKHSCECPGHQRWGTPCKHISSLLALILAGKL